MQQGIRETFSKAADEAGIAHMLLQNDIQDVDRQPRGGATALDKESGPGTLWGWLANMGFNLGMDGLMGLKQMLNLIKAEKYDEAADDMLRSQWASQVGGRARRLAPQVRTGEWQ